MKLTAQTFQNVVRSIRAQLPPGRDRTADNQIQGTARIVLVRPGGVTDPVLVTVSDLTASGISIVHKRALKTGDRFLLLVKDEGKSVSAVLCTVSRWHPVGAEIFSISANFTRELHTGDMHTTAMHAPEANGELTVESIVNPARFCAHDEGTQPIDLDHLKQVEEQLRGWQHQA